MKMVFEDYRRSMSYNWRVAFAAGLIQFKKEEEEEERRQTDEPGKVEQAVYLYICT
jgi:hypothetical protein